MCAKTAFLYNGDLSPAFIHNIFIESLSFPRIACPYETGTVPFLTICIEGELGDLEELAVRGF